MEIKLVARVGLGVALLGMVGCAPIVWDRPNTTPAQLTMDNARCQLTAEGVNPAPDTGTISTGHFGRDAAAGLAGALVQVLAVRHDYTLCMEANGYAERAPGAQAPGVNAPVPMAAVVTSPVVAPLAPASSPPMRVATAPAQPNPEPLRTRYYPPPIIVSID
jgi:hypothetical protein